MQSRLEIPREVLWEGAWARMRSISGYTRNGYRTVDGSEIMLISWGWCSSLSQYSIGFYTSQVVSGISEPSTEALRLSWGLENRGVFFPRSKDFQGYRFFRPTSPMFWLNTKIMDKNALVSVVLLWQFSLQSWLHRPTVLGCDTPMASWLSWYTHYNYIPIWVFPEMVVPPKHHKMIILVGKPMV